MLFLLFSFLMFVSLDLVHAGSCSVHMENYLASAAAMGLGTDMFQTSCRSAIDAAAGVPVIRDHNHAGLADICMNLFGS